MPDPAPRPRSPWTCLATVLPGLEDVLVDELRTKFPAVRCPETARGKVVFATTAAAHDLRALRTADNLYALVARLPAGRTRAALADLERALARVDLGPALAVAFPRGAPRHATFAVNASRAGDHTYSRFEAAAAAERGLARRLRGWAVGTSESHDVELRLDVAGADAWLSLRLTDPAFRFRGHARASAPGALRPSAAHGLGWLTQPAAGDVFLDPFCGTGTLVAERAAYPHARVLACDRNETLLAPFAHGVFRADARALPLRSGSVDAVATNLPFGHQVLTPEELPPGQRLASVRSVSLRGRMPVLWVVRRGRDA